MPVHQRDRGRGGRFSGNGVAGHGRSAADVRGGGGRFYGRRGGSFTRRSGLHQANRAFFSRTSSFFHFTRILEELLSALLSLLVLMLNCLPLFRSIGWELNHLQTKVLQQQQQKSSNAAGVRGGGGRFNGRRGGSFTRRSGLRQVNRSFFSRTSYFFRFTQILEELLRALLPLLELILNCLPLVCAIAWKLNYLQTRCCCSSRDYGTKSVQNVDRLVK